MPASLIEHKDSVRAGGDLGGNLVEVKLHSLAVAGREHECGTGSALRADRAEQVGGLGALIMRSAGARAPSGPAVGQLIFLSDPHLILEPDLYRSTGRELRADFRQAGGKVFLNACMASGSCL